MDSLNKIKEKLRGKDYNFLRENEHLGNNIIMLTVGGSYAYGTNVEGSDIDIRGCALNSKREILTNKNFDQFINEETDTVIYSFNKLISLLSSCNPNIIELLGNKAESYFYLSDIGEELLGNADLFLSRKAAHSFGGYAKGQLKRLDNKIKNKFDRAKLGKHMMHLIRLYYMCFDILEKGKIITYREKEQGLLMNIRKGKFLNSKNEPIPEFYEIVNELERRLDYAKNNTLLSEKPDYKRIEEFVMYVNERVVIGE